MVNHTPPQNELIPLHSFQSNHNCTFYMHHAARTPWPVNKETCRELSSWIFMKKGRDNVLLGVYYCYYWTQSRASFWPKSWTVLMPSHVLILLSALERPSCIPRHNTIAGVRTPDLEHWTPSLISWVTLSWLVNLQRLEVPSVKWGV